MRVLALLTLTIAAVAANPARVLELEAENRQLRSRMEQLERQSAAAASWRVEDGHLRAPVDLLSGFANDGSLTKLVAAQNVWLDIGVNANCKGCDFSVLDNGTLYLGFEPLLDKYALNAARGVVGMRGRGRLGAASLQGKRGGGGYILPFAVADNDDQPMKLHVATTDGCSSLLPQRGTRDLVANGWSTPGTSAKMRVSGRCLTHRSPLLIYILLSAPHDARAPTAIPQPRTAHTLFSLSSASAVCVLQVSTGCADDGKVETRLVPTVSLATIISQVCSCA